MNSLTTKPLPVRVDLAKASPLNTRGLPRAEGPAVLPEEPTVVPTSPPATPERPDHPRPFTKPDADPEVCPPGDPSRRHSVCRDF